MNNQNFSRNLIRRYAKSLLNVALKHKQEDIIENELIALSNLVHDNVVFKKIFFSPSFPRVKKFLFIEEVLASKLSIITIHFLKLLLTKRRESGFIEIQQEYTHQLLMHKKYLHIHVKSIRKLTQQEKKALEEKIESVSKSKVFADYSVEPYLIGGIQVRYNDFIHGRSVRDALFRLREHWMKDVVQ